jgi:hypothetical protein
MYANREDADRLGGVVEKRLVFGEIRRTQNRDPSDIASPVPYRGVIGGTCRTSGPVACELSGFFMFVTMRVSRRNIVAHRSSSPLYLRCRYGHLALYRPEAIRWLRLYSSWFQA